MKKESIIEKVCTNCKIKKDAICFRLRFDKRKRQHPLEYLNYICRECERNKAHIYYQIKCNNSDFKHKNRARIQIYARKNQVGKKLWQKRKNDLIYINAHNQYLEENSEKIKQKQKVRGSKWHRKHCDSLSNTYIKIRLKSTGYSDEMITSDLIRIKRSIIKEQRYEKAKISS